MLAERCTRSVHRYRRALFATSSRCLCTVENNSSVPKLIYEVVAHRPYIGTGENVKSGSSSPDMLSLTHLVRYRRGRNLLLRDDRRDICKLLSRLCITKVDGCCLATQEGKECYKTINGLNHKESESLIHFSLGGVSYGRVGWATCQFPTGVYREPFKKRYPLAAKQTE